MKRVISCFLVFTVFFLLLVGCGSEKYVGTWTCDDMVYVLEKSGSCSWKLTSGGNGFGTWKKDGKYIVMNFYGTIRHFEIIDDTTLKADHGEGTYRKK